MSSCCGAAELHFYASLAVHEAGLPESSVGISLCDYVLEARHWRMTPCAMYGLNFAVVWSANDRLCQFAVSDIALRVAHRPSLASPAFKSDGMLIVTFDELAESRPDKALGTDEMDPAPQPETAS